MHEQINVNTYMSCPMFAALGGCHGN